MDIELRQIRERPFAFYFVIALVIHIAIIYGVYRVIVSPLGNEIRKNISKGNVPERTENTIAKNDIDQIKNESIIENNPEQQIPPFQPSAIVAKRISETTFIHDKSGLLFADEIILPNENAKSKVAGKPIIEPEIHREFTVDTLPRQYRNREWSVTLRVKVNKNGDPVGNIKVVKTSGDAILDQLTINRIKESRFEPAHYEGTTEYFDYTFDMEIKYL